MGKPFAKLLHVAEVDVARFAGHVLAVADSTDGPVELWASIATADNNWLVDLGSKWL